MRHYSVRTLVEIDDIDEVTEHAIDTVAMLLNESTNRDKYDRLHYINEAMLVLDMLKDRSDQLPDDEE